MFCSVTCAACCLSYVTERNVYIKPTFFLIKLFRNKNKIIDNKIILAS